MQPSFINSFLLIENLDYISCKDCRGHEHVVVPKSNPCNNFLYDWGGQWLNAASLYFLFVTFFYLNGYIQFWVVVIWAGSNTCWTFTKSQTWNFRSINLVCFSVIQLCKYLKVHYLITQGFIWLMFSLSSLNICTLHYFIPYGTGAAVR